MKTFTDLESLKFFLERDASSFSMNPIRFINVDSMAMWVEVKKYLLYLSDETMPLSVFCEGDDTTPNIKRLKAALKQAARSQFIAPLSEYLRIIPEKAGAIIAQIIKADYQNNDDGKLRIYFLMYRMKSLLKTMRSDDPRTSSCIVLFETNEESDYKLTIVQKALGISLPGNELYGFRSYLEYWEANPNEPLILHTDNAIHFEKNRFFDDVRVIVTSYDLVKYQFGLPAGISEDLGDDTKWNALVKILIREKTFESACCSVFLINKYSVSLFEKWKQFTEFEKWLFWLWTRQQNVDRYEVASALSCTSREDYIDRLYCDLIEHIKGNEFDRLYDERREVLSLIQSAPTDRFWNETARLNRTDALSCLTSLTDIERKAIFEIISDYDYTNRGAILPTLRRVYPQLYFYLQNDVQSNRANLSLKHEEYFSEYKWLKATDTITEEFVNRVNQIASEKGASVFEMQSRNYFVTKHYDDETAILFVDGMGAEYLDYLAYLFSDLDERYYSVTIEAGFCVLPSETSINKDFLDGRNVIEPPIRELDELKHSNISYPESLIKQLCILDALKNRVIGLLGGSTHKIIIASDHGTSRMAVKIRNTEYDNIVSKPDNVGVYKYGRFCGDVDDEPKYPTTISYNNRLIFADYSRFAQKGAPVDEIHGGASLEEWIVPIITIEHYSLRKASDVVAAPKSARYRMDAGTKQVRVSFTISGEKRKSVSVKIDGNTYKCNWNSGAYSFTFIPKKANSTYRVRVFDEEFIGQFDIEIEQGIRNNTDFDI